MSAHDRQKVQSQLDYVGDDALVHAVVERLLERKVLVGDLRRIARADFRPKLSGNQRKLKDKLVEAYQVARFQPPEPASFVGQAGGNAANLKDLLDVCATRKYAVPLCEYLDRTGVTRREGDLRVLAQVQK
jgi:selenocysteine-specific elongation factor